MAMMSSVLLQPRVKVFQQMFQCQMEAIWATSMTTASQVIVSNLGLNSIVDTPEPYLDDSEFYEKFDQEIYSF